MKKNFTLVLAFVGALLLEGNSQNTVYEGDATLTSQSEVNSFQYAEVTGTLYISGDDITDLSPLEGLAKVGRLLITDCNSLTTLDGLSNINKVTATSGIPYTIGIAGNAMLKNLDGLSGLSNDSLHSITISNNPSLESINAFSSAQTVFGLFSIANNASLTSMNGFRNITSMQGDGFNPYLLIDSNPLLTNLDGFSSLESIAGPGANLDISNNASLSNLEGLSSLTTIAGGGRPVGLFITNNDSLTNVDGLRSLSLLDYAVAGAISITGNERLQHLDGLSALSLPSRNFFLTVRENPSLTKCDALFGIILAVGIENASAYATIEDNGGGCTLQDIIANGPPAVVGIRVIDRRSGEEIINFGAGDMYLEMSPPAYRHYIMQATTINDKVGSVVFRVGDITRIDNQAPFQFDFQSLPPGDYTVTTEAYSLPNKKGIKGMTSTTSFALNNGAAVQSFVVVDDQGNIVKYLQSGDVINTKDPAYKSINIVASVYPQEVAYVVFHLNNRRHRTEYEAPYSLQGDHQNKYNSWKPRPGAYTLRATPYAQSARKSYAGQSLDVSFTVVEQPMQAVTALMIADRHGNPVRPLHDGDKIDLADSVFTDFQIVAITTGEVGSVKFRRNGQHIRTENQNPYSVSSHAFKGSSGYHLLSATPYPEGNGKGEPGQAMRVFFRTINGLATPAAYQGQIGDISLSIYPVPVRDQLNVKISGGDTKIYQLSLRNYTGRTVFQGTYDGGESTYSITMADMPYGLYYLEVQGENYRRIIRFVK